MSNHPHIRGNGIAFDAEHPGLDQSVQAMLGERAKRLNVDRIKLRYAGAVSDAWSSLPGSPRVVSNWIVYQPGYKASLDYEEMIARRKAVSVWQFVRG